MMSTDGEFDATAGTQVRDEGMRGGDGAVGTAGCGCWVSNVMQARRGGTMVSDDRGGRRRRGQRGGGSGGAEAHSSRGSTLLLCLCAYADIFARASMSHIAHRIKPEVAT